MENTQSLPVENQSIQSQPFVDDKDSILIKCQECEKEHNSKEICADLTHTHLEYNPDFGNLFRFRCIECGEFQEHQIDDSLSGKISEILSKAYKDSGYQFEEEVESRHQDDDENQDDHVYYGDPDEDFEHAENSIIALAIPATQNITENKAVNVDIFKDQIKKIDKNLTEAEQAVSIRNSLQLLADQPSSNVEICLKLVKEEFKLNARDIEAFRKDFNNTRAQADAAKKQNSTNQLLQKYEKKPKVLTEQEKSEALAYLKNPDLIANISRDLTFAGEIIGEETNKMMLYFSAISRKFEKPISLVIFGKSSSGKSFLANAIEKFVPEEDSLTISSSTARAFDYLGDDLKHKFVLVQEWEGIENILPTIRVLQSEGKLSRLVSVKNPEDATHKTVAVSKKCPCTVVFTTTREDIHDENSTRIFELYADESLDQTKNVVRKNILKSSIKYRNDEAQKKQIIELHKNVQRVLEPITVDIPFAEHINFPAKSTRNRRDSERFIQLIKAVAFLRQKQKQVKEINGKSYVEADDSDYQVAYTIGIKVIAATLDQISDRARNALRVCCELTDDLKKNGQPTVITAKQIQEKAPTLGLEFDNRQDLNKQLEKLAEHEYLSLDQPKFKGTKYYTVIFHYARDEKGEIMNISTPEIKEITTPDQIREKLLVS